MTDASINAVLVLARSAVPDLNPSAVSVKNDKASLTDPVGRMPVCERRSEIPSMAAFNSKRDAVP